MGGQNAGATNPGGNAKQRRAQKRAEKQEKKLRKALKRIGELRRMDYMSLTTDQRVKIHGEHEVLEKLGRLGVKDVEALRRKLQPGCVVRVRTSMPTSTPSATETHG